MVRHRFTTYAKNVWDVPTLFDSKKGAMAQSLSVQPSFQGFCPILQLSEGRSPRQPDQRVKAVFAEKPVAICLGSALRAGAALPVKMP